jgi:SAM-dependent methyltransferase
MMVPLLCPVCDQVLAQTDTGQFYCIACGNQPPETCGIPDLRNAAQSARDPDVVIVQQMLIAYHAADYNQLLDIRLKAAPTFKDLVGHEVGYMRTQVERGQAMIDMFQSRLVEHFGPAGRASTVLDLGCGSGGSLLALAKNYEHVVGIDPSLPDLLLAAKLLESNQITNVTLIQAYGQHLPFASQCFDCATAVNVLEHVFDVDRVLGEIHRVLRPGGRFVADSRNRLDLFLPEPHVKLRWVGLLPRRWASHYVYWRRGVPYEVTYLLSYADLQRGLRQSFGRGARITFPKVSAYGSPARVDEWLSRLEHAPILNGLALRIFPSHLVLAERLP